VAALSIAALWAWVFRDVLFRDRICGFRDALFFYYPLFEYARVEWGAGRIPLWNPFENAGLPFLANPATSVLYPAKLIFALPLPAPLLFNVYIALHVLLAAGTMYWVVRRWGHTLAAAVLAAISYAFCGNVLFQYSNVIYLCGAAWLPLALYYGERMLTLREWRWGIRLAVVLTLMTLAGDPQMAYQAGLLVALLAFLFWLAGDVLKLPAATQQKPQRSPQANRQTGNAAPAAGRSLSEVLTERLRSRVVLLGMTAALSLVLAAAQILPTREFASRSERGTTQVPRSLWGIPGYLVRSHYNLERPDTGRLPNWYDTLIGDPPPPSKHESDMYDFSVEPWRLVEYLWPNFSGDLYGLNNRWTTLAGWERQPWTASLYMGLIPVLLAVGAWSLRGTDIRIRWISLLTLLGVLASFGIYGPRWLAGWGTHLLSGSPQAFEMPPGGGAGGLYWLFVVAIPGFAEFRYPAKLLVVSAAGLSLLAAAGFDQLRDLQCVTRLQRRAKIVVVASAVAFACFLAGMTLASPLVQAMWPRLHATFQVEAAARAPLEATAHAAVLGLLLWGVLSRATKRGWLETGRIPAVLLVLSVLDLAIAQRDMILSVPSETVNRSSPLVKYLDRAASSTASREDSAAPLRIYRLPDWNHPASADSLDWNYEQVAGWRVDSLAEQMYLLPRISVAHSHTTIVLNDYEDWFRLLPVPDRDELLRPRRALDIWGAEYFVLPTSGDNTDPDFTTLGLRRRWPPQKSPDWHPIIPTGTPLEPPLAEPSSPPLEGLVALENPDRFPRAWVTHVAGFIPSVDPLDRRTWMQLMQSFVYPVSEWFDLRHASVVEDDALSREYVATGLQGAAAELPGESCRIISYIPDRVEIEAVLREMGLVVLSDSFYPGWRLEVLRDGQPFPEARLLKTNRVMRGTLLPAGTYRIVYRYRPWSFWLGVVLSAIGWSAVVIGGALVVVRRRQHPRTENAESVSAS